MKFSSQREVLLKPLQAVIGVVERRQTMPILANVLLVARDGRLSITATDLEVELVASTALEIGEDGEITVPGRKLFDICRALPDGAEIKVQQSGERVTVRSGRSRFTLMSLAASDFPVIEDIAAEGALEIAGDEARRVLEKTHFSMAHQDVRYYLNGLLLEVSDRRLRAVATDGHRLALCESELEHGSPDERRVIVPRKGVTELQRLLAEGESVKLSIGSNHIRAELGDLRLTSKLIDGRFPDYEAVIPKESANRVVADRETLRAALQRTAILSNEKYRGIRLEISQNRLLMQAHNPEQEEAEEEVEVDFTGTELEIGFNVNYLLDALGAIDSEQVELGMMEANSSCLITAPGIENCKYVVMPMRL